MPIDVEKASQVVNTGLDVLIDELRSKSTDHQAHLTISDTTAAVNSGIGAIRQVYSGRALQLRIISMLSVKEQRKYLPTMLLPELNALGSPGK